MARSLLSAESALPNAPSRCSQAFHCRYGKAYLFSAVSNVRTGPREERLMTTGLHTVADISCTRCNGVVGWKYEEAHEKTQRYKEGKVRRSSRAFRLRSADLSPPLAVHSREVRSICLQRSQARVLTRCARALRAKLLDQDGHELRSDTDE